MVAHLLELRHGGEDQPTAFDALGLVDPDQHVVDDGLIKRGLLAGQGAELLHLELVGEVGDDRPVGLQAAKHEGAGDPAESGCGLVVTITLDRDGEPIAEGLLRAQACPG